MAKPEAKKRGRRKAASAPDSPAANGTTLGFEAKLWQAADKLRNNMDAAEYKHVVLGLIFLKYISDAFEEKHAALSADKKSGADPEDPDEYRADNIFWVPKEARRSHLQGKAKQSTIGKLLDDAMVAIERDNPSLKGVLPKDQLVGEAGHGTGVLPTDRIQSLQIPVPPVREQHAIADIIGALDAKIALNDRMNATLEAMARALFKSWFIDFDPVRAKAEGRSPMGINAETAKLFPNEFIHSPLGDIPEGFSAVPLYDIATFINGAAYKAFDPTAERRGLPIIKIAELKAGVTQQTKFSDVAMPEKYRLSTGDILFSWSGNPDTSIDTFVWTHGAAWLNQHIFRVIPHHDEERAWVLTTLKYLRPVFAEIARNKQTTGLGHVTAADMKRLLVAKPDKRMMAAWNRIAGPLLDRMFRNCLLSQRLSLVRDALLPRLLSGEASTARTQPAMEAIA